MTFQRNNKHSKNESYSSHNTHKANKTQWPLYNKLSGNEDHEMPKIHKENIYYKNKSTENFNRNIQSISFPKATPNLLRKDEDVNW